MNSDQIKQALVVANEGLVTIQAELGGIHKQQCELIKAERIINERLRDKRGEINNLTEALIIAAGIPDEVAGLREDVLGHIKTSQRHDVLVKTAQKAKSQIEELKLKLQDCCRHQFIVACHPFEGSSCNDFSDSYPPQRLCVICGLRENGKSSPCGTCVSSYYDLGIFEILTSTGWRLVKFDKKLLGLDIWQSLDQLVEQIFLAKETKELLNGSVSNRAV
ncbi:MAG: hypothetical protein ABH822_02465 [Patescibacteria group bacterium]